MSADAGFARALEGTPLLERFRVHGAPLFEQRMQDAALRQLAAAPLRGVARAVAATPDVARVLSHRPRLLERLAGAGPGSLARRARELETDALRESGGADLESFLDELRLLRRDEMAFAACLDLGGLCRFDEVSGFLSTLAECIVRRALARAAPGPDGVGVVAMGKLAGRELTYHSDLDLIFVYSGNPLEALERSRLAQRLISYLTTMTGAGVAYAVDSRLRPSGRKGVLVSTLEAFESYQRKQAATWEHLALMRSRAIAGDPALPALLERLRCEVSGHGRRNWPEVVDMRERVLRERGGEKPSELAFKAGRGGLMDVEFLAAGLLLELGAQRAGPLPATPAMLRTAAAGPLGGQLARLVQNYAFLRLLEARTRLVAGRAVETLRTDAETLGVVAELVEPGLSGAGLLERASAARDENARAFESYG